MYRGNGDDDDALLSRRHCNSHVAFPGSGAASRQMNALFGDGNSQMFAHAFIQQAGKQVARRAISLSQTPKMRRKIALIEKIGDEALLKRRRETIKDRT